MNCCQIDKDLTITGPGADLLTVARSSAKGTAAFMVFDIFGGNVTIGGLTISNGDGAVSPTGGGLHSGDSNEVLILGCGFTNNKGKLGGRGWQRRHGWRPPDELHLYEQYCPFGRCCLLWRVMSACLAALFQGTQQRMRAGVSLSVDH